MNSMRQCTRILLVLGCAVAAACATPARIEDFDTGTSDATDVPSDLVDTASDTPVDTSHDTLADTLPDTANDTLTDTGSPDVTDTVPDGGGGVVGDPCYSSAQCSGVPGMGRTCLTSLMGYVTFPGGYCSATCTSAADCGSGAQCVNLSDLGNYCLKQCSVATDCRTAETYSCTSVPGVSGTFCIPPISSPDS